MSAFNIWLGTKLIDTVFYSCVGTIADRCESVKRSLIEQDGYGPEIRVTWPKGQRVTSDHWELHGYYSQGWECLCASTSRWEALIDRKAYMGNEPGTPLRIVKKREYI